MYCTPHPISLSLLNPVSPLLFMKTTKANWPPVIGPPTFKNQCEQRTFRDSQSPEFTTPDAGVLCTLTSLLKLIWCMRTQRTWRSSGTSWPISLSVSAPQLKQKTAELTRACHKHYELEQELAFLKIDAKFEPLPFIPAQVSDSAATWESVWLIELVL